MLRWTGVVLAAVALLPACKKKRESAPDPVAEIEPIKEPTVVPVRPNQTGLPESCERYRKAIERVMQCSKLPQETRDALKRSFEQSQASWSEMPADVRSAVDPACTSAADALQQAASVCGDAAPSRNVPGERGVPLDQTVLGPMPHPFGALEILKPTITREEILSALPNAQRDGDERITVPLGVEDLIASIDIDFAGRLDVAKVTLPAGSIEILTKAWGKPSATNAWFDRKRRWRADFDESDNELMIGPFTPLAEILGKGPDGLAETKGLIGATPAELTARFGPRVQDLEIENDDGVATPGQRFELLLPATEFCKFYTNAELEVVNGRVAKLHLSQCFDDEAARRGSIAAMESKWGRVIPGRTADDRPVFTFALPGRKVEMTLDEQNEDKPGWQIVISK